MATLTAQNLLDANNYTVSDVSLINTELLIDQATRWVSLMTGRSIGAMGGTAGSKTVSMEDDELAVVSPLAALMVRAYVDRGPNTAISNLSVSTVVADPQYSLFKELVFQGLPALREMEVSYG